MANPLLWLAFVSGALAPLAPCALPLLPGYLSFFLGEEGGGLTRSLALGALTAAGFHTVFTLLGLLPSFALREASNLLPLISPFLGLILIAIGAAQLLGRALPTPPALNLSFTPRPTPQGFYLYGVAYGAASLACSYPIFTLLVFQAAKLGSPVTVLASYAAWGLGSASVLLPLTLALATGRQVVYTRVSRALPALKTVNSLLLLAGGLYLVLG